MQQPDLFSQPATPPAAHVGFLTGLIAIWRYGGSPKKKQTQAAEALAEEFARRINELPD